MTEEDPTLDEDSELVCRAQQGDAEAYDHLMLRYQDAIARQMRRYSSNMAVIEDLTQTVFVNAYQGLRGYRPEAPFAHWLRTIAANVGYEHWRRESRQGRVISYHDCEEMLPDASTEREVESDDVARRYDALIALMEGLKPPERQILFLLYVDGVGMEEVARRMGWNRAATKMRAYRARIKLRGIIRKHGMEGGSYDAGTRT